MQFSCTQENLSRGLNIVSHITSKNINLPILNNVLIKIKDKNLALSTTNLELAINCFIRGRVEKEGEFTIPSRLFADYVGLLPREAVNVEALDENVTIKCANYETKIKGLPASEFPLIPQISKNKKFNCSVAEFRKALGQVVFAVSLNESRPELSGVYMEFNREGSGGQLFLAATDSYRLGEAKVGLGSDSDKDPATAIVPSRTMSELLRIIALFKDDVESPESIELAFSENQIIFTLGGVELISRLIEGQYPDYTQIVPTGFKTKAIVSKDELMKAIKTTSLFSKTGLFDVTLEIKPDKIMVMSSDLQRGENKVDLKSKVDGEDNSVTLNYRYLLEGLNALGGEEITISMIDAANPSMLTSQGKEKEYFYIIMPIKR